MAQSIRTAALAAAAALMLFGAATNAMIIVPDLHGDLIEIGVRPSVLGATVVALHFAATAMFGFTAMVVLAAIQASRGIAPARLPLAIIAGMYAAFGVMTFARSHNPHHLGMVLMAVLLAVAIAVGNRRVGHDTNT